jgi:hypothetical protein
MDEKTGGTSANPLARAARDLTKAARYGILCSLIPDDGYPFGSLAEVMPLEDGDLILFLSELAEHRRYLAADSRASVVIAPHIHDPRAMASPRVTLVGRCELIEDRDRYASSYVRLHPTAASYINFADFQFFRFHVERARYIAGFGQMGWMNGDAYRSAAV